MASRETSLSDIEFGAFHEVVAQKMGNIAIVPIVEITAYAEWGTHSRFPNQLLIPGDGFEPLHEKIVVSES